jgi:hypothetical protein
MSRIMLIAILASIAVSGCAVGAPSASPSPSAAQSIGSSPLAGPFNAQTVERAVQVLATGGVEVRVGPDDAPLTAATNPSRVRLLRWQARNLALEASAGAGTLGADLDNFAAASEAPPLSALVAGWLHTADSPAVAQARQLLPGYTTTEPQQLVISNLVMLLFVADVVGPATASSAVANTGHLAAGGAFVAVESDFCASVAEYLNGALAGILDPALRPDPDWLADAIELYAEIEPDPERLRAAIGALALLAYATSISRPWVATISAVPTEAHYLVEGNELAGNEKQFTFNVNVGDATITDEAAECGELAGVDLDGSEEAEGTEVGWLTYQLLPHAVDLEGDLELEGAGEFVSANYEYQTRDETEEAHSDGQLNTVEVLVGATAVRQDIAAVEAAVSSLLTAGNTGMASAEVAAQYAKLEPALRERLNPSATTKVTITWHVKPDESPTPPSPEPTDDEFCRRYKVFLRWQMQHEGTDYELSQPWAAEIADQMEALRAYAPPQLVEHVNLYVLVYRTYATVPEPANVPVVGPDAARIADAFIAMTGYCGISGPEDI